MPEIITLAWPLLMITTLSDRRADIYHWMSLPHGLPRDDFHTGVGRGGLLCYMSTICAACLHASCTWSAIVGALLAWSPALLLVWLAWLPQGARSSRDRDVLTLATVCGGFGSHYLLVGLDTNADVGTIVGLSVISTVSYLVGYVQAMGRADASK